jgi:hypothetical protein
MTPKEKAQELYNKFYAVKDGLGKYPMCFDTSKQCASIAVDEIIQAIHFNWIEEQNLERQRNYWEEVKNEIKQL